MLIFKFFRKGCYKLCWKRYKDDNMGYSWRKVSLSAWVIYAVAFRLYQMKMLRKLETAQRFVTQPFHQRLGMNLWPIRNHQILSLSDGLERSIVRDIRIDWLACNVPFNFEIWEMSKNASNLVISRIEKPCSVENGRWLLV